nr:hypothetical protein MACL_00000366 [Theileria orientalis]
MFQNYDIYRKFVVGNESSVHIYLDRISGETSKRGHYDLKAHNKPYDRCNFFTKVTYEITYKIEYPWVSKSTEFYIYFRKRSWTIINFTYYPYFEDDVVEKVYYFFSRIRPDEPLVIGFTTRGKKTKYYRYADLNLTKSTGLPQGGFAEGDMVKNLWNENKKINKKFTFIKGKGKNVHINGIPGEEEPKLLYTGEFKSVFRKANIDPEFYGTPNGSYIFYSDQIFTINQEMNKIDNIIFEKLNRVTFYGIYVYYTDKEDIAVLVELVKDFNDTIFIARKNKEGSLWEKAEIRKNDNTEFNYELQKIERAWTFSPKYGISNPIDYTNIADATSDHCDPSKTKPVHVSKGPHGHSQRSSVQMNPTTMSTSTRSFSSSTSSQSRSYGTTSVRSPGRSGSPSHLSSGNGPEAKTKSPKFLAQNRQDRLRDTGKDTRPPPAPSHRTEPLPKVKHSPAIKPDRGENETRLQSPTTQHEGASEERDDKDTHSETKNRHNDTSPVQSSFDRNPLSPEPHTKNEDYDDNDDQTTTNIKIVGGVATTAIGAGSIGAGGYYANGVLSVIKWLV